MNSRVPSLKSRSLLVACLLGILLASSQPLSSPVTAAPLRAAPAQAYIADFPSVTQWYNLSCEYAAAAAVTLYWHMDANETLVSQRDFVREVPSSPNPHLGFRGDINGEGGGIHDYGIYAEPLVPVLQRYGYDTTVFYGGVSRLKASVAAGNPVVAWITAGKYVERPVYYRTYNGDTFKIVPGEHAVVVYGYDSGGVHVMDVGDGGFYYTEWDSFLRR